MEALVIIDMQAQFEAARCFLTIANILKEIKSFKSQNLPIILVEYRASGYGFYTTKTCPKVHQPTLQEIKDELASYDNVHIVLKSFDDGGEDVHNYIVEHLQDITTLFCCGVNTGFCVHDTVFSLSYNYAVRILANCCNHIYSSRKNKAAKKANGQYFQVFEENGIDVLPSYTA